MLLAGLNLFIGKTYSQALPIDESMLTAKLENGLTYYIKSNKNPENQVELRLVINTGSLYEEDSEQGFAHFVEHMCFNGTENFPGNEVISYLETKGMRFGRHFNALTSFAETKYMLSLPNPDEELLNNAFQILEDWAHQVSFEDEEIEKERGVIIQEYRTGLGPETRLREQLYPAIFRGARYQYRLPIGKKDILETFQSDELREFYYKWYHPERMAVIVVGDVDKDKALALVEKHFAHIENNHPSGNIPSFEVGDNEETVFNICADKETSKELVRIYYLDETAEMNNYSDLRTEIIKDLIEGMITKRLREINQSADSPFIVSQVSMGYLVRTKDAFTLTAVAKPGKINEAFHVLLTENRRLQLYGFSGAELDMEKKILARQIETTANEKEDSKALADKYMDKFLKEEPPASSELTLSLASELIPAISLDEVNTLLTSYLKKKPVISANIRDIDSVPEFKNQGMELAYQEILASKPEKYVSLNQSRELVADIAKPGKIVKESFIEDYNITEWTLSNGAKVVLKPTDFENDEVLFSSISKGGISQYNIDDYVSASLSAKVAFMSGLDGIGFSDLRNMMQMEGIRLGTWMSDYGEGTTGYSGVKGIEALLNLNYLYFTRIQADSAASEAYISRMISQLEGMKNEPDYVFGDTIYRILYGSDSKRFILSDSENYKRFDLDRANQIIKERYEDPSGFTFVFVGNFDMLELRPLVEKYIGGLQGPVKKETVAEEEYFAMKKSQDITVFSGTADKSMVDMSFVGELPWTIKDRATAKVMTEVLKIKLRKALREEKSGVYGISVSSDANIIPDDYFKFEVFFQCSPALVDTLINEVYTQLALLKKEGPEEETLDKVKKVLSSEYEQKIRKNSFWKDELTEIYGFERVMSAELSEFMPAVMTVSAKDVQKMAKKKLKTNKMLLAKMYPEKEAID